MAEIRGTTGMLSQAEQGLKLFEAQAGTAAEYDKAAAEKYKAEIDTRMKTLEDEAALLTGKDNKKERAAKGKEVAELKAEQRYVDACKIVKGLEPKFGNFVTKAAVIPDAPIETKGPEEDTKVASKKDSKKETKKESAGLSPAETKELENLKQSIVERKTILKEQGMSGGQQNKDEEVVKMVARMNELKEKQEPGSTKKEKDAKKDKKTPLSAEEQKEFQKLQGEIEIYKAKLRTEFGYSNKDIKAARKEFSFLFNRLSP